MQWNDKVQDTLYSHNEHFDASQFRQIFLSSKNPQPVKAELYQQYINSLSA